MAASREVNVIDSARSSSNSSAVLQYLLVLPQQIDAGLQVGGLAHR